MPIKFRYVSWEELQDTCFKLSKKLDAEKIRFDRIVCISRGGLVVARIFSDYLNLPVSNFTIVSYAHIGRANTPRVVEEFGVDITGETILLVDEIVDRGDTLACGVEYVETKKVKKIITLSPFVKPHAKPKPDYYTVSTTDWVVFPYEVRETVEELTSMYTKKGYSKQKIQKLIYKIPLPKDQVKILLSK